MSIEGVKSIALLPAAIAIEEETALFFPGSQRFLPEATTIKTVSLTEAWKAYVESILGFKAWSQVIEANFSCKQLRAELGDRGIQPAPKTRKTELARLLAEGAV